MSIASEITRISNAKTAIATSVGNKGVTVPAGTKIDGMAALIDQISGGGGGVTTIVYTLRSAYYTRGTDNIPWAALTAEGLQFDNWQDVMIVVQGYLDGDLSKPMGGWYYPRTLSPTGSMAFYGVLYLNGNSSQTMPQTPSSSSYVPTFGTDAYGLHFFGSSYQWTWGSALHKKVKITAFVMPSWPSY